MKIKISILVLILVLTTSLGAFAQTKTSKEALIEAQIIALEKSGWEAWKNKDTEWFEHNTTSECLWINKDGISNKTQMIQYVLSDCDVKSIRPENFKFIMLTEDTVLLTYTVLQDGICTGTPLPSKVRSSVNYVKRNGKWLEAFYMETTIAK